MKVRQQDMMAILIGGRASQSSTEAFIAIAGADDPVQYIDLWSRSVGRLGYIELRLVGTETMSRQRTAGLYEVAGLHPADYQCPGPIAELSGVLWPRREVLEQISARRIEPDSPLAYTEPCNLREEARPTFPFSKEQMAGCLDELARSIEGE